MRAMERETATKHCILLFDSHFVLSLVVDFRTFPSVRERELALSEEREREVTAEETTSLCHCFIPIVTANTYDDVIRIHFVSLACVISQPLCIVMFAVAVAECVCAADLLLFVRSRSSSHYIAASYYINSNVLSAQMIIMK